MIGVDNRVLSGRIARHLGKDWAAQQKHMRRLSTGKRITRAEDDAAGLAVSMRISASARSRNEVARNIDRSLGVLQTGEGGLQRMQDMTKRLRELAVQAADGFYTDDERAFMQTEVNALVGEIDRTARSTFATSAVLPLGKYLIDFVFAIDNSWSMGPEITAVQKSIDAFKDDLTNKGADVEFGLLAVNNKVSNKGDSLDRVVKLADMNSGNFKTELAAIPLDSAAVNPYDPIIEATEDPTVGDQNYPAGGEAVHPDKLNFRSGAERQMIYVTDTHTREVYGGTARANKEADAIQALKDNNMVFSVIGSMAAKTEFDPLTDANGGGYYDIGSGGSGVKLALDKIVAKTPINVSTSELEVQAGPNTNSEDTYSTQIPVSALAVSLGLAGLKVSSQTDAKEALKALDATQVTLNEYASRFGAAINRLHTMHRANEMMQTEEESTLSRIQDLDIASETSSFVRTQIRTQAGTSLLAQSHTISRESVLRLLGTG